jgi:hypothetical protein
VIELFSYLLTGIIAGILAGLLGIGGGTLVVPILDLLFSRLFPENLVMHMAIGTSLAIMMFTTASSTYAYHRHRLILWPLFIKFIPGMVLGTLTGSFLAKYLSNHSLRIAFAIFLFIVALKMFDTRKTQAKREELPHFFILTIAAFFTGVLSGFFGVGGGTLMVPFFVYYSIIMQNATGTSAVCGFVLSIIGTISLIITGLSAASGVHIPAGTTGFVYWPAVLPVALTSILFAPLGTKIAVRVSANVLQRCFAVILILTALYLFLRS